MSQKAWYEDWFSSPYYYMLYQHRDDEEANLFMRALLQHLKARQNDKMLDVACGKGRHSKALADMGFDVTGIDLSESAILEALQNERENLHFFQHDMRLPFITNYFDFVFNFFTSFGYFRTQREHDNAFRTIAQSLNQNGIFVIDYLNVHFSEDHLRENEEKKVEDVTFYIKRWHNQDHFFKQIEIKENGQMLPESFTERVSKFTLGDFTEMLAYQGLQVQEVFGDYHLGHYDVKKSPRMIIVAKKMQRENAPNP